MTITLLQNDTVSQRDKSIKFVTSTQKNKNINNINKCNDIQGVSKNLLESGEQYIVVSRFSSAFSGCLTRGVISAARIVLFKFYK